MKSKRAALSQLIISAAAVLLPALILACSSRQSQEPRKIEDLPYLNKDFDLDVRWGASPRTVMQRLFTVAELRPGDVFYDLGSGDGRVVVEAVKQYGLKGKGVDIDPARIIQSRERAAKDGVAEQATFINESFFDTDFSDATVVFAFLNNTLNRQLRPRFLRLLKPGTRIIMHTHDMGEWEPDFSESVKCHCVNSGKFECHRTARLYIVPANVAGTWEWSDGGRVTMKVRQSFQKLQGTLAGGKATGTMKEMKIQGEHISFTVTMKSGGEKTETNYTGIVRDGTISGTITEKSSSSTIYKNWTAKRDPSTWVSIDR